MAFFARLYRSIPLLIILAVLAGLIYLFVQYRYSPSRAKEILIKLFIWICGAIAVFFALASAYALFEHNQDVFDFMATLMCTAIAGLIVTLVCRAVFLRHHPEYRSKAQKTTKAGMFSRRNK